MGEIVTKSDRMLRFYKLKLAEGCTPAIARSKMLRKFTPGAVDISRFDDALAAVMTRSDAHR